VLRGSVAWVCRGTLVAILLAAGASGVQASVAPSRPCGAASCSHAGTIRWQELLPGAYAIHNDSRGTVPVSGEPYAAIGANVAVFGLGLAVTAYNAKTGTPRWTVQLKAPRRGGQIVSARVWPGVVTVGVAAADAPYSARSAQTEVVLDASDGRLIRSYPRIAFGGAVAADARRTVVVGPGAVTSYDNRSGRVIWRRPTGGAPQRWELDGHFVYVAVAAGGYLSAAPVTALRKIDLRSGAQRVIPPRSRAFAGTLSAALAGVVLFTKSAGVTAYSGRTGHRLWHRAQAVPQAVDLVRKRFYLSTQTMVAEVDPSGRVVSRLPGSSGLYGERGGVAFGLDQGANGQAWAVDAASKRVVWSTGSLPWPHVFVDLSGLGGSADPRSDAIILMTCGQAALSVSPPQCAKPELVVINR